MKTFSICCSLAMALALVAFVSYNKGRNHNLSDELPSTPYTIPSGGTYEYQVLVRDLLEGYKSQARYIPPDTRLTDSEGKEVLLSEVIQDDTKVIFRFSKMHCGLCVDAMLPELKKISKELGSDKIVLLAAHYDTRNLQIFKKMNELDNPIFNIDTLQLTAESIFNPYVFVLDNDYHTKQLFIPRKESIGIFSVFLSDLRYYLRATRDNEP